MEEEKKIVEEIGEKEGADAANGTPSPSPSKKKQKQVHGILKSGKKEARNSGVVWDEDNLIYNESNKSATMKIDEPPTPYNKEYDSAEDDEEESTSSSEKEKGSKSDDDGERTSSATRRNHREDIKTEEAARAHFDQVSTALEESKRRPARTARPRFSSDEDTTEDDEGAEHGEKRGEFKKKRMQHYNEWKRLQEFRRSHSNDASEGEDDAEEEEDDDKDRDDDDTRTAKALRT
ncbi:uncharacterized protein ACA1_097290 [Acanthamoeba castellanii str. Neff]|uniref:Uncharacterized protein n=1 Tax=Acanthamoeba castellanii (strain ATCC 30010 / Neff) TaxID=1257118 RepID=L8GJ05_ACACF|nr:uncharacterized protein ACA1_097290 [Acanthamoeba castellanii str. Neff]ELR13045.1 hypothetical protein ACA1_097290 [Acanthamoeba castellanii str. Neff]